MKKKLVSFFTVATLLFTTPMAFAGNGDIWKKSPEGFYKTAREMTKDKVARREVTKARANYYFEVDGHLFTYDQADQAYQKDNENFMATLKPADAVKPVPAAELAVASVSAITKTEVEVELKEALAEEVKGATLNVVDNNGATVAVVAKDLAKGATVASFKFVKALDKDPEGKWMVNGVAKDLDVEAKLLAVKKAGDDQLKLKKALEALEIKNLDPAKYPAYAKANKANVDGYKTVEEVQAMVDKANELNEDAVVKAVQDAIKDNNQVALAAALANPAFKRVNPEWIKHADGYLNAANGILPADNTIEKIQTKIDGAVGTAGNAKILAAINMANNIDREKLDQNKKLFTNYAKMKKDGMTPVEPAVATALKTVNTQLAVVDAIDASTPSSLKSAIESLKELDPAFTEEYIVKNGSDYVEEIGKAAAGAKDDSTKIAALLKKVNDAFDKFVIVEQPDGIKGSTTAQPEFVITAFDKKGKEYKVHNTGGAGTFVSISGIEGTYQIKGGSNFANAPKDSMTIEANAANVDLSKNIGQTLDITIKFSVTNSDTGTAEDQANVNKEHTVTTQLQVVADDISEAESEKDLKADKTTYAVEDTMTITFTLKDGGKNVVHAYDDTTTDAIVKINSKIVSIGGKAEIKDGKVTVTAKANAVEAENTYSVTLVKPALVVESGASKKIAVETGEVTDFKAEKGTVGVKLTPLSGSTAIAGYDKELVLKNVSFAQVDPAIPYMQDEAEVVVKFAGGSADNLFISSALASGKVYTLKFTFDGKDFNKTIIVP